VQKSLRTETLANEKIREILHFVHGHFLELKEKQLCEHGHKNMDALYTVFQFLADQNPENKTLATTAL